MGQYYKPMSLESRQWLYTHDYGNGLKLMEHSYIGNDVLNAVESLLIPGGAWYKTPIVWAGDYADGEPGEHNREIDTGDDSEDEDEDEDGPNLYSLVEEDKKIHPSPEKIDEKYRYLTNHTKQLVIDLAAIKPDEKGFQIHPLSLFTAEGNGRGGGDFRGEDARIGTWARDILSLEDHVYEGYQFQDGQFKEEGW